MDPNATLAELRQAIAEAEQAATGGSNDDEIQAWQEVGELVAALDQWLTRGGFLPDDWGREGGEDEA